MTATIQTAVASAPGKVILFGEHAVVYGVTAIAAALSDLRIFVEISSTAEETIEVQLHDVTVPPEGLPFSHKITLFEMRSLFAESSECDALLPVDPTEDILQKLRTVFEGAPLAAAQGMMAIVYLVAKILPGCLWPNSSSGITYGGMRFSVKSKGLPIGAGLGSSAAFSVALSAALLRLRQQQQPFGESLESVTSTSSSKLALANCTESEKGGSSYSSEQSTSAAIPLSLLPIINGWAYAAEVVIHGSPSGLDNTTSCYGGAVRFRKGEEKFENISNADLPHMRILLTNTRVPRSTKLLVAAVRVLHDAVPKVIKPILESIEGVSGRFLQIITESKLRKSNALDSDTEAAALESETAEIGRLLRVNHHLLCALGVGHPALSAVVEASAARGLPCKLTGAGGGGCAITLLPTHSLFTNSTFEGEGVGSAGELLESDLNALGFDTFESSLAGAGVQWP